MFDKTKVVLIGCVACSGVFLDTFSAVWADPVPIEKTELMAPLPVRFMSKVSLDLVKPVPRDPRLPPRESPPPLFTPDPLARMMSDLSGRLREHWKKHEGKHEQIIVLFHLHKDGSVTNLKVQRVRAAMILMTRL